MTQLLIVGGASLDTLHLIGQTVHSAGGAGMYTSMAAIRSGVSAGICAPRPDPLPAELAETAGLLAEWNGPVIGLDELPHFEIEHRGDKAIYLNAFIGAEEHLTIDHLPADLSSYDCVHLTPLGNSHRQQEFIRVCRQRKAKLISAGTYLCTIKENEKLILESIELADVFFMNEEEACLLFGSLHQVKVKPAKLMFVTLGEKGVLVVQGEEQTRLNAIPVKVLDPTGAGDSFCGATLAGLILGVHPVMAAQQAMALASEEITAIGLQALLHRKTASPSFIDARVRMNREQITRISGLIKTLGDASPFAFIGKDYPPVGNEHTVDYFFATVLQQFGFWETTEERYDHPLVEVIDGDKLKGSAYLFRAYVRKLYDDPDFYSPRRQAELTCEDMVQLFRADNGSNPMPALDLHLHMALSYGKEMLATNKTPQSILERAQQSSRPLKTFISELDQISGYKEDPLRKKSNLLALVLHQRPEQFLSFSAGEAVPPVIDYHTMRGCLRMGLVEILDNHLKRTIVNKQTVSAEEEWAIRCACYLAVEEVVRISGKSLGAVDWFFFYYSRQHCPEMSEPVCVDCAVNPLCAHRKELFQPVMRTTYY